MEPNAQIPELLQRIAQDGSGIRLVNLYKGLPIIYEATLSAVEGGVIYVQCNRYQVACLYITREAYLIGQNIPGTIHADVTGLIPARDVAIMTNLAYVEKSFILRDQIRVEPVDPIKTILRLRGSISTIETNLADISLNGMGVYIDRGAFHPKLFQVGGDLEILLPLPVTLPSLPSAASSASQANGNFTSRFSREAIRGLGFLGDNQEAQKRPTGPLPALDKEKVSLPGRIMNIRPELNRNRYRLGLRVRHEDKSGLVLSQFISLRQSEIIREFGTIYETLKRAEKVKTPPG